MTSDSIDKKKEEKKEDNKTKNNNWSGFAIGCLVNFILVLMIGFVVSNFMYLTSLSKNSLDTLFPSDNNEYFQQGGSVNEIGDLGEDLRNIGVPPTPGWPYTMKKGDSIEFSIQGFKNWFAFSVADTYAFLRNFLKTVYLVVLSS